MDFLGCLQETYIENHGKQPYLWRGNIHVTPGLGNSLGCITLLSSHLDVIHSRNFGNRAHLIVIEKLSEQKPAYVLINLLLIQESKFLGSGEECGLGCKEFYARSKSCRRLGVFEEIHMETTKL